MRRNVLAGWLLASGIAACGGGGGGGDADWLYPLWVPTDVAVADLDGDGRNDVLTLAQYASSASAREGRLAVHRQSAGGALGAAETYVVGLYPWRMAIADIDGDGAPDVVIADVDGRDAWLLLQDPASRGRFLAPQRIAQDVSAYDVAIADLNGDHAPDIAISDARKDSARVVLLYQDPANRGSFGPPTSLAVPGSGTSAVAARDLDGDARPDLFLAVSQSTAPNIVLATVLQRPDGTPGPVTTVGRFDGLNVRRLAIADYDGDGLADLLAYLTPATSEDHAQLVVLLQQPGTFGFAAPALTSLQGVKGLEDAVFADLDGDGRPDAAVAGFYPVGSPSKVDSRLNRFTQAGGGLFAPTASTDIPFAGSCVTAGDLDGDRRNELVVLGPEDRLLVLQ